MKLRECLSRIKIYFIQSLMVKYRNPKIVRFVDLIKYFSFWWSSLSPQRNPLDDKLPWLAFSSISFIKELLNKEMVVFEYGAGGSTLFFSQRVKKVFTIEHNKEWFEKILEKLKGLNINNIKITLLQPRKYIYSVEKSPADPNGYVSDDEKFKGMSFIDYVKSIDKYPDNYFDIILIDGRSRPSCFKHSINKVKKGGYVIFDNAEISYYSYIHEITNNKSWCKYDFYGPHPYTRNFSWTCVWRKL